MGDFLLLSLGTFQALWMRTTISAPFQNQEKPIQDEKHELSCSAIIRALTWV